MLTRLEPNFKAHSTCRFIISTILNMYHFIKLASFSCTLQTLIDATDESQLLVQVTGSAVYIQRDVVWQDALQGLKSD